MKKSWSWFFFFSKEQEKGGDVTVGIVHVKIYHLLIGSRNYRFSQEDVRNT